MSPAPYRKEEIIDKAIAIADADGLSGLSMRRLASELGAPVMSLYRHVESRDALLVDMTNKLFSDDPYPRPIPNDWRDAVTQAAHSDARVFSQHPWTLLTSYMPRLLADSECLTWTLEALAPLTTDPVRARECVFALWAYTSGHFTPQLTRIELPSELEFNADFTPAPDQFDAGLQMLLDGMAARLNSSSWRESGG